MSTTSSTLQLSGLWSTESASVASGASIDQEMDADEISLERERIIASLQLAKELDKYELVKQLGYGFSGDVFLSRRFHTDDSGRVSSDVCAVKAMRRSVLGQNHKVATQAELDVLKKLRGTGFKGVVQLQESFGDEINRYIVMELIEGGSVLDAIRRADGPLDATYVRCITAELVHALLFLKSQHIVHRDIKPENILLTACGHAVLADFGLAVDLDVRGCETVSGACGTPGYMAPETMMGAQYSYGADAFSLGATMYHCLVGFCPFEGKTYEECKLRTSMPVEYPGPYEMCYYTQDFISRLLRRTEKVRMKLEDAKDTAYFEGIDWERVAKWGYEIPEVWLAPANVRKIRDGTLDKDVLYDWIPDFCPWPMDADELKFTTPLYADGVRRERIDSGLDARALFEMPEDDVPAAFGLEFSTGFGLGNISPNGLGRSPSMPGSPQPDAFGVEYVWPSQLESASEQGGQDLPTLVSGEVLEPAIKTVAEYPECASEHASWSPSVSAESVSEHYYKDQSDRATRPTLALTASDATLVPPSGPVTPSEVGFSKALMVFVGQTPEQTVRMKMQLFVIDIGKMLIRALGVGRAAAGAELV